MIGFLTKSDASTRFDQIVDFLNAHMIQYALMIEEGGHNRGYNLTTLRLDDAAGVDCLPNEEIFAELARMGYEKPSTKLTFYKAFFLAQWKFPIHTILQCMSAKRTACHLPCHRRIEKGFSGVDTPLFAGMLVQPQVQAVEDAAKDEDDDNEVSVAPTPPSPTLVTPPPSPTQEPIPSPPQAESAQPSSPS
nr:hypothetical protein [Tanacetum cinerariifolium]GFA47336.1 hypothetical protein [Tanacetum cinerariifolium]